MKRRAYRAFAYALLLSASITAPAYAQTSAADTDKPVAARPDTETANPTQLTATDIAPERLSGSKPVYIRSSDVKRDRENNRNRWNPATLTQTTGLQATRIAEPASQPRDDMLVGAVASGVLSSDLIKPSDLLNAGGRQVADIDAPQVVQPLQDGVINLRSNVRDSLFDLSGDSVNASVFKLDLGERLCLGTAEECEANVERKIDVGYAKNITHGKTGGLNLQLTPRAGLRFDDDSKSALVGALVRIGDNLREGSEMKSNTWYLFAGADAEATTYTPGTVKRLTSGDFHLQDRIIVGDAQAGVGYRLGDADLALSYFKRQATAENYSYNEDAAALSITWKR